MAETKQRLKEMIVERLFLNDSADDMGDDDDLRERYALDSVKVFDLVIGLEEVFGISFEGDEEFDLEKFTSVNHILGVMKEKGVT